MCNAHFQHLFHEHEISTSLPDSRLSSVVPPSTNSAYPPSSYTRPSSNAPQSVSRHHGHMPIPNQADHPTVPVTGHYNQWPSGHSYSHHYQPLDSESRSALCSPISSSSMSSAGSRQFASFAPPSESASGGSGSLYSTPISGVVQVASADPRRESSTFVPNPHSNTYHWYTADPGYGAGGQVGTGGETSTTGRATGQGADFSGPLLNVSEVGCVTAKTDPAGEARTSNEIGVQRAMGLSMQDKSGGEVVEEVDRLASRPLTFTQLQRSALETGKAPTALEKTPGPSNMAQSWPFQQMRGHNAFEDNPTLLSRHDGASHFPQIHQPFPSFTRDTLQSITAGNLGQTTPKSISSRYTPASESAMDSVAKHGPEYDGANASEDFDDFDDPDAFDEDMRAGTTETCNQVMGMQGGRIPSTGMSRSIGIPAQSPLRVKSSSTQNTHSFAASHTPNQSSSLPFPLQPPSPAPELQYPQGVSGTPADFMRNAYGSGAEEGVNSSAWDAFGEASGVSGSGNGVSGMRESSLVALCDRSRTPPAGFTSHKSPHDRLKGVHAKEPHPSEGAQISDGLQGAQAVRVLVESSTPGEPPKKVKMHQCGVCKKLFPRPSGLATHMNSHSGARPFKCPLDLCPKTFAVRSNARRHLRTHGITLSPSALKSSRAPEEPFQVGFETPVVIDVQDPLSPYPFNSSTSLQGRSLRDSYAIEGAHGGFVDEVEPHARRTKLKWVPPSLADRVNAGRLRSLSPASDMADVDVDLDTFHDPSRVQRDDQRGQTTCFPADASPNSLPSFDFSRHYSIPQMPLASDFTSPAVARGANLEMEDHHGLRGNLRIAPMPLPPALPTDDEVVTVSARFDERNSRADVGTQPYHPDQFTRG